MSIDTTVWATDLDSMISDLQSTLVWVNSAGTSQSVACTISPITKQDDVQVGGIFNYNNLEAYVKISSFTLSTLPSVRDPVTVGGRAYHVDNIEQDSIGARLMLRRV